MTISRTKILRASPMVASCSRSFEPKCANRPLFPNPGDLLCAALAACADSTVRMVADVLGVQILDLRVEVHGEVDVRGCLAMGRDLKVGFRSMSCRLDLRVPPDTAPQRIAALRVQGERSCVNLDTLRSGVPVELAFEVRAGS
jgi:uncharacterized OsmC-like protein